VKIYAVTVTFAEGGESDLVLYLHEAAAEAHIAELRRSPAMKLLGLTGARARPIHINEWNPTNKRTP
jgi:hypothetical protein